MNLGEKDAVALAINKNFLAWARRAEHAAVACLDAGLAFAPINDLVFVYPFARRDFENF